MRSRRARPIATEVTPASSNLGNARATLLGSHIWSGWMPFCSSIRRSMSPRKRKPANQKKKMGRPPAPKRKRRKKRQRQPVSQTIALPDRVSPSVGGTFAASRQQGQSDNIPRVIPNREDEEGSHQSR